MELLILPNRSVSLKAITYLDLKSTLILTLRRPKMGYFHLFSPYYQRLSPFLAIIGRIFISNDDHKISKYSLIYRKYPLIYRESPYIYGELSYIYRNLP